MPNGQAFVLSPILLKNTGTYAGQRTITGQQRITPAADGASKTLAGGGCKQVIRRAWGDAFALYATLPNGFVLCDAPAQPQAVLRRMSQRKGQGYAKSGLLMSSYESLMKGTRYGYVIVPDDSLSRALITLIEGRADPSIKMPHGRDALPKGKTDALQHWGDQGAKNN